MGTWRNPILTDSSMGMDIISEQNWFVENLLKIWQAALF